MWAADQVTDQWVSLVQQGGTAGLILMLIGVVWAFTTDRIVSGARHRDVVARHEAEETRLEADLARASDDRQQLAERALPILERASEALRDAARGYGTVIERVAVPSQQMDIAQRRTEMTTDALTETLAKVEAIVRDLRDR